MRGRALGLLLTALVLAAPGHARAQTDALEITDVQTADYPTVELTVTVPREVADITLPPDAFGITEDGEYVGRPSLGAGGTVDEPAAPRVVLAIDTSGSMRGDPIEKARAAAAEFVSSLRAGSEIAVVTFANRPSVVTDFTSDKRAVLNRIAAIEVDPAAETALYDGVYRSNRLLARRGGDAPESIVVLSDGDDTVSRRSERDVVADVDAGAVTVWAVGLESSDSDRDALVALAGEERRVLSAANADELRGIYLSLASDLSRQYLLRYDSQSDGRTTIGVDFAYGAVQASTSIQTTIDAAARPDPEPTLPVAAPDPFVVRIPLLGTTTALAVGLGAVAVAAVLLVWVVALAPAERSSRKRLLPAPTQNQRSLTVAAEWITDRANRRLERMPLGATIDRALEHAGLDVRVGEFAVGVLSLMVVAAALGLTVANVVVGVFLALIVVLGARLYLSMLRDKRQAAFADQFIDVLQLLAGNLRAGYGLPQGVDVVSRDAEEPAASEFRRILIEHRLGRDLTEAMNNCAQRMDSDDFAWVVQAIDIHRDVGGDLARVLDNVVGTVRERAAVQRQVRALSAEGRLSARVLTVLPVLIAVVVSLVDPTYFNEMTSRPIGLVLIGVAVLMLLTGMLLVRQLVKIRY